MNEDDIIFLRNRQAYQERKAEKQREIDEYLEHFKPRKED